MTLDGQYIPRPCSGRSRSVVLLDRALDVRNRAPLLFLTPLLGLLLVVADGPGLVQLQAEVAEPLPRVLPGRLPPVRPRLHHRRKLVVAYLPVL